jgi:hypothetical protein
MSCVPVLVLWATAATRRAAALFAPLATHQRSRAVLAAADVKMNLQETDYGNFLQNEVCCGGGVVVRLLWLHRAAVSPCRLT